jgi:tetratricopeptide (TPR) repeat protein
MEGLNTIEGMLKHAPANSDLHHLAGIAYSGLDDSQRALKHFIKVKPASKFYHDAVMNAAYIYDKNGNPTKTIALLSEAAESKPNDAEFKYYLATCWEEAEDYEKAEKLFKKAVELDSNNARYYFRLGVVYDKWNKLDASVEALQTAISLDPKHTSALNYLGYIFANLGQNLDEAERLIKQARKYKPNDGYITDSLGWVYFKQGKYEEALSLLKSAAKMADSDPVILEHLGDVYKQLNNKEDALYYYQLSLNKRHSNPEIIEKKILKLDKGNKVNQAES